MAFDERKRVWIDAFQSRLVVRIAGYFTLFLIVFFNLLFAWKLAVEGINRPVQQYLSLLQDYFPVILCLAILVPVMAWDAIRFSHRLIGPLARFRSSMEAIARGEAVRPIKLREADYLTDLCQAFNEMLDSLQRRGLPVVRPDVPVEDEQSQKKLA
jgi:methyl-accepting chemotaxis protein